MKLKLLNNVENVKKKADITTVLLVYCEMQTSSPSVLSMALTETQKVQFVPEVSPEITAVSCVTVVFWEPHPVVLIQYVYSFLYCCGWFQDRLIAVVFKVTACIPIILSGPTNTEQKILKIKIINPWSLMWQIMSLCTKRSVMKNEKLNKLTI